MAGGRAGPLRGLGARLTRGAQGSRRGSDFLIFQGQSSFIRTPGTPGCPLHLARPAPRLGSQHASGPPLSTRPSGVSCLPPVGPMASEGMEGVPRGTPERKEWRRPNLLPPGPLRDHPSPFPVLIPAPSTWVDQMALPFPSSFHPGLPGSASSSSGGRERSRLLLLSLRARDRALSRFRSHWPAPLQGPLHPCSQLALL